MPGGLTSHARSEAPLCSIPLRGVDGVEGAGRGRAAPAVADGGERTSDDADVAGSDVGEGHRGADHGSLDDAQRPGFLAWIKAVTHGFRNGSGAGAHDEDQGEVALRPQGPLREALRADGAMGRVPRTASQSSLSRERRPLLLRTHAKLKVQPRGWSQSKSSNGRSIRGRVSLTAWQTAEAGTPA